ncbi:TetR/AcrR family transcriptional regulator [Iamia sp. SCSIO 61187]|uniref:TetR/AcrR family transcriptional regulator n=1 Tax=Iamia sp. SCSIO 61187 TaxID=2722752 RepID=UPI001C62D699|nr:TetR/AcrR family transcriptional regulator [Iamia sp. SCSIO 61187]QYG93278.1 TetR/AcrR family transcriptional regulator [Iamia sp. SCSIO 61187]
MTETAAVTTAAQERALDATVALVARWGVTKTTLGDVARAAGMSRATLYRTFPGGKDELFGLLAQREVARFLAVVGEAADAAPDLATALTDGLHAAAVHLDGHAAIRFVLDHEPELAVPVLGFGEMDRLLRVVQRAAAPHLVRFFGPDDVDGPAWAAEWGARLFLSALVNPTPAWDLSDRAVCARLVDRYLAPALTTPTTDPSETPSLEHR